MNRQRGFTLLEIVIALAVTGIFVALLASAIGFSMRQTPKEAGKLVVENEMALARYWVTHDANCAESYTALADPQYCSFEWSDFSGEETVDYVATYYYASEIQAVMREEEQDGVVQSSFKVADNILSYDEAIFTWSAGTGTLTVDITPTIEEAPAVGDISRDGTIVASLRYEAEPLVAAPGEEPVLPPPPGSETYYVAADPTIISGTYVPGNAASLSDADTDYYVVSAVSEGSSKVVTWSCLSENISTPATIDQLEIRFSGKTTKKNVAMEFYVKDSSGDYPSTPDSGFTFTEADTESIHSFYLDAATVSYIEQERVVSLKVSASAGTPYELHANQVLFIASPP